MHRARASRRDRPQQQMVVAIMTTMVVASAYVYMAIRHVNHVMDKMCHTHQVFLIFNTILDPRASVHAIYGSP